MDTIEKDLIAQMSRAADECNDAKYDRLYRELLAVRKNRSKK